MTVRTEIGKFEGLGLGGVVYWITGCCGKNREDEKYGTWFERDGMERDVSSRRKRRQSVHSYALGTTGRDDTPLHSSQQQQTVTVRRADFLPTCTKLNPNHLPPPSPRLDEARF